MKFSPLYIIPKIIYKLIRKSIIAACRIKKGEIFTRDNLAVKRPGNGISPMKYWQMLGQRAERDYEEDEVI